MESKPDHPERRFRPGKNVSPRLAELEENFRKNGGSFKKVKLGELFTFKGVKQAKRQELIPSIQGGIPYVVQSQNNNMVKRYVDKNHLLSNDEPYEQGNAIVLGVTLPAVSYQEQDFGASQVITARSSFLKPLNALYFVAVIKKAISKFSYTYKPGIEKYKNLEIIIPIVRGSFALDYMEQFVRELEAERVRELEAYLLVSGLNDYQLTDNEREILRGGVNCKFKYFKFYEIFAKAQTGDFDIQRSHVNGKGCLYINSGLENQGIVGMTDVMAKIFEPETITVDMFGLAWYRDFAYKMATHAHVFSLSTLNPLSPNCLLYLVGTMFFLKKKYNYSNMCNWSKMLQDSLLLPVLENGDLDTAYMDSYITALKKSVIKDVVEWKDRELSAFRQAAV